MANERFESVWDALADTPEESANLKARAELMHQIRSYIASHSWTQEEAAVHCNITKPRINDLLCGRISKFNLADLKIIAAAMANI